MSSFKKLVACFPNTSFATIVKYHYDEVVEPVKPIEPTSDNADDWELFANNCRLYQTELENYWKLRQQYTNEVLAYIYEASGLLDLDAELRTKILKCAFEIAGTNNSELFRVLKILIETLC